MQYSERAVIAMPMNVCRLDKTKQKNPTCN